MSEGERAPRARSSGNWCRSCVWWQADGRKVTIAAPCALSRVVRRPVEGCSDWQRAFGSGAEIPLLRSLE